MQLRKVTLNLVEGDREIIQSFYPRMGYQQAIRQIIHQYCRGLQERANQEIKQNVQPIRVDDSGLA